MRIKILLVCSIVLNAALGIAMLTSGTKLDSRSAEVTVRKAETAVGALGWELSTPDGLRLLYDRLIQTGLDGDQAKRLCVLAVRSHAPRALEYWKPDYLQHAADEVANWESDDVVRKLVVATFGAEAITDAAFVDIFAPLQRELPGFLPERQRDIQSLRVEGYRALLGLEQHENLAATRARIQSDIAGRIQTLLGGEESLEYGLRFSGLARRLLNIEFDFTEAEFRDTFVVLSKQAGTRVDGFSPLRIGAVYDDSVAQDLRSRLGADRFAKYEMAQDPRYRLLQSLATSFNVSQSNLREAYTTIKQADVQIENAQAGAPVLSVDARAKLVGTLRDRDDRLRQLLGDAAYEAAASGLSFGVDALRLKTSGVPARGSARTPIPVRVTQ